MKGAPRKLRVFLVDQEGMLRDALCALINSEEELTVAHLADNTAALRGVPSSVVVNLIIVDFAAPAVNPSQLVELARSRWPNAPILVLTADRRETAMEMALHLGVDGYVLKSDQRIDFRNAIRRVLAGKRYISPTPMVTLVEGFVHPHSRTEPPESDGLSEREREVMRLIATGLRTREIAAKLCISSKTADKHRTNLMRKLGLRTAAAVAAYAILNGYFPHD